MISLILRTTTRVLLPLLLLFAVFLLLRGHNEPGGGFIAGLVVAAGYALHALAYSVEETRRLLRVDPRSLLATGLLAALGSGLPGVFVKSSYLAGSWSELQLKHIGTVAVGTPLLFDLGVFLVVVGMVLTVVLALAEA
jgi:multicomponent Na+:H+ antiporter subunit B